MSSRLLVQPMVVKEEVQGFESAPGYTTAWTWSRGIPRTSLAARVDLAGGERNPPHARRGFGL